MQLCDDENQRLILVTHVIRSCDRVVAASKQSQPSAVQVSPLHSCCSTAQASTALNCPVLQLPVKSAAQAVIFPSSQLLKIKGYHCCQLPKLSDFHAASCSRFQAGWHCCQQPKLPAIQAINCLSCELSPAQAISCPSCQSLVDEISRSAVESASSPSS